MKNVFCLPEIDFVFRGGNGLITRLYGVQASNILPVLSARTVVDQGMRSTVGASHAERICRMSPAILTPWHAVRPAIINMARNTDCSYQ